MIKISIAAGVVATCAFTFAADAAVVDLIGGTTEVLVTADLAALSLAGAPTGTATVEISGGLPLFGFGITGGTLDQATGAALIEHDGSGVSLSAGMVSATVGNFLIDTMAMTVSGTVNGTLDDVPLFTFGTGTEFAGVQLLISGALAGALSSTFGVADLTGAEFAYAVPGPEVAPVPLPAGGLLLIGAFGGLAFASRKRAA
jgi:hypothetical protein